TYGCCSRFSPRWILWIRTLKSIVAVGEPAATAAASLRRRAASLWFGLWQSTQYSTRLRRLPCTEKPFENSPGHQKHFWFSTTIRVATACDAAATTALAPASDASTENATTGFTVASLTWIDGVS